MSRQTISASTVRLDADHLILDSVSPIVIPGSIDVSIIEADNLIVTNSALLPSSTIAGNLTVSGQTTTATLNVTSTSNFDGIITADTANIDNVNSLNASIDVAGIDELDVITQQSFHDNASLTLPRSSIMAGLGASGFLINSSGGEYTAQLTIPELRAEPIFTIGAFKINATTFIILESIPGITPVTAVGTVAGPIILSNVLPEYLRPLTNSRLNYRIFVNGSPINQEVTFNTNRTVTFSFSITAGNTYVFPVINMQFSAQR